MLIRTKKERERKKRKKKTNSLGVRSCDLTVTLIEIIIRKKWEKVCPEKSYQYILQVTHSGHRFPEHLKQPTKNA